MKKMTLFFAFLTLGLLYCGEKIGTTQIAIEDGFDLDTSVNPTILDNDDTDVCPHFEFDSTNKASYKLLIDEDNPVDLQSTFLYEDTKLEVDGNSYTLSSENAAGSTFELTYDPDLGIYSLEVDFNCKNLEDTDCGVNSTFLCTGPLQD